MKGQNPLKIPLEQINEKEGTVSFALSGHNNLLNSTHPKIIIFDVFFTESRFALYRDESYNMVFLHWNTKTGIREAKMPITDFNVNEGLKVIFSWSEKENILLIGDVIQSNSKTVVATQRGGKIRVGKDGALFQIGDDDIKVGYYVEMVNGKENLSPTAKELWDNAIEKVNILVDGCKLKDFTFETTRPTMPSPISNGF